MSSDGDSRKSMDDVLASIRKIMRGGKADLGEVPKPGSASDERGASNADEWALPPGAISHEERALARAAGKADDSEDWSLPAGAVSEEEAALERADAVTAADGDTDDDEDDDVLALGPAMAVGGDQPEEQPGDQPGDQPAEPAPWETVEPGSAAEPEEETPENDDAELELMAEAPAARHWDEPEDDEEPFSLGAATSALGRAAIADDDGQPFRLTAFGSEAGDMEDAEAAPPEALPTVEDPTEDETEDDMDAGDEIGDEAGTAAEDMAQDVAEDVANGSDDDTDDIPPPPAFSIRPALSVLTGGFALGTGRTSPVEAGQPETRAEPVAVAAEPEPDEPAEAEPDPTETSEATPAAEAEPEPAEAPEAGPAAAAPALDDLEETIRRVIREELEGEIGARLSQNIRRLIRDEVARSLQRGD